MVIILFQSSIKSQTNIKQNSTSLYWLTLGAGFFSNKDFSGFGGNINASYYSNIGLLSVRFLDADKAGMEPTNVITSSVKLNHINEFSGMYGFNYHASFLFISVSSGIGIVWFKKGITPSEVTTSTLGLPLDAEIFISPLPVLGIGLKLLGNINSKSSYSGFLICLQLGKLK
jgi:hypothetical protein